MTRVSPLFVAALIVLAASRATAGVNRWTSVGPDGATVDSLAVAPTNPEIVYAGTERRVFKSANGGSNWSDGSFGLPAPDARTLTRVTVLEIDPKDPDMLYAGAQYQGLFKSRDGGVRWTHIDNGWIGGPEILDLALNPANPETLFVVTLNGLYKSTDGATTFTRQDPAGPVHPVQVEVDPTDPSRVYMGTGITGVLRSLDGGRTWARVNGGLPAGSDFNTFARVLNLAHHPSSPGLLYAYTRRGLYKTNDGGEEWFLASRVPRHPESEPLSALEPDAANNLYAATADNLYFSPDGGHNWSLIGSEVLPAPVTSLALDPIRLGTLYAGAGDAVFKTEDTGATWAASKKGLANVAVSAIALDPTDARNVYASGWRPGNFYKSVNGGRLWKRSDTGIGGPQISSIAIAGTEASRLYAAGSGGLYRSEDKGETWTVAGPAPFPYLPSMVIDPFDSQILYVGTCCGIRGSSQGVYKTMDGGRSWSQKQNGFLRTEEKWVLALAADPQTPGVLYAGTRGGVFKTSDGGESWTRTPLTEGITSLAIDPSTPAILYAALSRGGVFRSDDGGETWRAVGAGISHLVISSLAIDPVAPSKLYAGTSGGGVFRSGDRGETWSPFNNGLRDLFVTSVALDRTGRHLYVGTSSSGIFDHEIRGARVVPFRDSR